MIPSLVFRHPETVTEYMAALPAIHITLWLLAAIHNIALWLPADAHIALWLPVATAHSNNTVTGYTS